MLVKRSQLDDEFCDNLVGFVIIDDEFISLKSLNWKTSKNYCSVFSIGKISTMDEITKFKLKSLDIIDYLMAIPYVIENKSYKDKCLYYLVSKSGKELTFKNKLEFSHY
jgi:hypothetical protein